MGGRAGRLLTPSVLLSAWSMSVRCRSEVWDRWRRSPYCHSSCCSSRTDPIRRVTESLSGKTWTTSARRLISRLSRSMGLLRPDLGPVLAGEGGERGQVRLGVDQHLGDLGEGVPQSVDDVLVLGDDGLLTGLGEDGRDEGVDGLGGGPSRAWR